MDLPDINVKVLYDFDYTTKDGKQVSIKEGEKLFLIKKTNEDWWQVIRSAGRPFYVPASYVQEINRNKSDAAGIYAHKLSGSLGTRQKTVGEIKVHDELRGASYRSRSCSFESQEITHGGYQLTKPSVPKRTVFEKASFLHESNPASKDKRYMSNESKIMQPKFTKAMHQSYPEEEDDDEEADYVNLPKLDRISPLAHLQKQTTYRNNSDNGMSTSLSSTDSDRIAESNVDAQRSRISNNGYSQVNLRNVKTLPLDKGSVHLNLSNSLEELSQEICVKSSLIDNSDNPNAASGYRKVSDIVKHITKDTNINSKNINNSSNNGLKQVNYSSSSSQNTTESERSKLQYAGSFKTKHEREKWAKNYVLLTAMKEEEMPENQNCVKPKKSNVEPDDCIANNNAGVIESSVNKSNDLMVDGKNSNNNYGKNKPNVDTSNTDVGGTRLIRICDRISNYEEKVIESNLVKSCSENRISSLKRSSTNDKRVNNDGILNSSSEELAYSPVSSNNVDTMKSSASDKGSTDSLLDVDNPFGIQDGSLYTTASDSLLHTSDTSDEELKHLVHEKVRTSPTVADDHKKRKCVLTRNGRIESCRLRFPVRGVSPPVPELNQKPTRELLDGWSEYTFSDGRTFFYNCRSGEKSWKPPRRRSSNETRRQDDGISGGNIDGNLYCGSSSPLAEIDEVIAAAEADSYATEDGSSIVRNPPQDHHRSTSSSVNCVRSKHNKHNDDGNHVSSDHSNCVTTAFSKEDEQRRQQSALFKEETKSEAAVLHGSTDSVLSASPPPIGWKSYVDSESGFQCYVNLFTGARWFSSHDEDGRVYYFEENSSESSWTLPSVATTTFSSTEKLDDDARVVDDENSVVSRIYYNVPLSGNCPNFTVTTTTSTITINTSANVTTTATLLPSDNVIITSSAISGAKIQNRAEKTRSLIIAEPPPKNEVQSTFVSKNWPQLWDGHMCVLKEGTLNRTKITENGKRLRKNWASSHVVLTELFLLFFKDAKAFAALKTGGGRPEMCVDLNGALIDRGDKVSSRKNVYIISTVLGLQVLIQNDCTQQADLWLLAIQGAIKNLPSGFDSCPRLTRGVVEIDNPSPESESSKKFYKVTRSKSVKTKNKDGSIEDLTVSPAERQTKIKARLKKFFHRRPTMESLVKKGIWKDEPVFGSYLEKVCPAESPRIPLFVQQCIGCIEKSEENMKTDGLYRASGNLSQVQKIRLQVDQNNLSVIEEEEDVHVLTGALKLFFRELKEPLIPYHSFHKAIKASNNHNKKEKIGTFREITKSLPAANHDTLKFLLQHLLRVTKYKEFNRMHIPNLAIVFGPTLMWPEQESMNMALDLMQQNLVIECFLLEFDNIFK